MPNIHRTIAATVALSLVASMGFAQRWQGGRAREGERTVHLKSTNYRRESKRVKNRAVRFLRQKSNAPCVLGRSWGYTRDRIWVDRGCEADFAYVPR